MLHFLICDDNKNTLDRIVANIKNVFSNNDINAKIVYATTNASKALNYLKSSKIDVVLLDIDLASDITGLDIAKQIRQINKSIYIIFLTGHFEYSMLAYKVKTFDFLIKPISYAKLEETILRLYEDIHGNKDLFIQLGNNNTLYKADDIIYIEKNKAKAIVHNNSLDFQIYGTINQIQSCLPEYFLRCSKSIIVNTQKITRIDSRERTIYVGDTVINYSSRYIDDERKLILND